MLLMSELAPDVVLLDLSLPDTDGRDVCRRLRLESDVPIIMVTASGTVTDRVVGLELGADDYVVKPFATGEVYVNHLDAEEATRIRAAYGHGYERLVALKNKYDPTNLFRLNQNIKPTV